MRKVGAQGLGQGGVPRRGLLLAAGLTALGGAPPRARAQAADPAAELKAALSERLRIVSPNGIEATEHPLIGGLEQWVSIRGQDRSNPVILFLHGGPGFTMSPLAWAFQQAWEDHFTVVQWDQRGAGKTFARNGQGPAPLTLARMREDAEEMAAWVRTRLGHRKLVVMGHSWGSVLGLHLAATRPEWLHAYVGVGQLLDTVENERLNLVELKRRAAAAGRADALAALEAISPYPEADGAMPLRKVAADRHWVERLNGMTFGKVGSGMKTIGRMSPYHSEADYKAFVTGQDRSALALLPEMSKLRLSELRRFECPILIWMGEHDLATSPVIAERWVERLKAPVKRFTRIPSAAHMVFTERPGLVHQHLLEQVLPLTRSRSALGLRKASVRASAG